MENMLNRKGKGEGVDEDAEVEQEMGLVGIDRIEVGEVELGEKFPILSNARVRPSGQNGGVVSLLFANNTSICVLMFYAAH